MTDKEKQQFVEKMSSAGPGRAISEKELALYKKNKGVELYFKYGTEGGGEELYRIMNPPDGQPAFVAIGSSMFFDENDNDDIKNWEKFYSRWPEFWAKFTENKHWFYFHPVFIHADCHQFVRQSLDEAKQTGNDPGHHFESWEETFNPLSAGRNDNKRSSGLFD